MTTAKVKKKRAIKVLAEPELATARLVLPAAKIRLLVSQIILADSVAPFVRRMVILLDDLRAGRTETLARAACRSRNRPFAELTSAMSRAARQGLIVEAEDTAFYAVSYAYRNSVAYLLSLRSYLDGFRRTRPQRRRKDSRAASPVQRRR
jgi:hypothetical protein